MVNFVRIKSGIEEFDQIVDHVRLGDNVIMQVSKLDDFKKVAIPFVRQAIQDERDVYYIRFSNHSPFFEKQNGLTICELNPGEGFEKFTTDVHKIIEKAGKDAFSCFCVSVTQY